MDVASSEADSGTPAAESKMWFSGCKLGGHFRVQSGKKDRLITLSAFDICRQVVSIDRSLMNFGKVFWDYPL
jgi:hypothetical protein